MRNIIRLVDSTINKLSFDVFTYCVWYNAWAVRVHRKCAFSGGKWVKSQWFFNCLFSMTKTLFSMLLKSMLSGYITESCLTSFSGQYLPKKYVVLMNFEMVQIKITIWLVQSLISYPIRLTPFIFIPLCWSESRKMQQTDCRDQTRNLITSEPCAQGRLISFQWDTFMQHLNESLQVFHTFF